ncbi:MAG: hypothetical protein IJ493_03925 [Clostridia bacterium]|nr:hypothetical protein [Clostridia bacterium]
MKRSIAFLLALLSVCTHTAACGESTAPIDTTADTSCSQTAEITDYRSNFPSNLDFGGESVHIFGWEGTSGVEFTVEEQDGEIVNDAIYNRNATVENHLNVELEFTLIPGNYSNYTSWLTTVRSMILAGDGSIDIIGAYTGCAAILASEKLLLDLNELPYFNFDQQWWSQSLVNESSVENKLYFASGDISTNLIHSMFCVFFNKDFVDSYNLENPYDLVRSGKWTIDKMSEMTKTLYADLNGNGTNDLDDQYGFITRNVTNDSFFYAAGLRTTTINSSGISELAFDSQGERIHALLDKLITCFNDPCWLQLDDGKLADLNRIFTEGRALFLSSEVLVATTDLRYSDIDYGVLPIPKYDETVENYETCTKHTFSLYGIPVDAPNAEMSAAVLECFAIEGYYNVSPALFETALKVKYASDDDASEMYDIIRNNCVFDFGRIFGLSLNHLTYNTFRNCVANGNSDWFSAYDTKKVRLEEQFDALISTLMEE